jgi:hypothetical protein
MLRDYDPVRGAFTVARWPPQGRFDYVGMAEYDGVRRHIDACAVRVFGKYVLQLATTIYRFEIMDWKTGEMLYSGEDTRPVKLVHMHSDSFYYTVQVNRGQVLKKVGLLNGQRTRIADVGEVHNMYENRACVQFDQDTLGLIDLDTGSELKRVRADFPVFFTRTFEYLVVDLHEFCQWDLRTGEITHFTPPTFHPMALNHAHTFCIEGKRVIRASLFREHVQTVFDEFEVVLMIRMCRDGRHIFVRLGEQCDSAGSTISHSRTILVDGYAHEDQVLTLLQCDQLKRLLWPYLAC